eukprot:3097144-Pyramimonas_sp.AAC.1
MGGRELDASPSAIICSGVYAEARGACIVSLYSLRIHLVQQSRCHDRRPPGALAAPIYFMFYSFDRSSRSSARDARARRCRW